jgi:hypothetical protein
MCVCMYVCVRACVRACARVCVCVCVCLCSGISLEHLERFQLNLVQIWLYVCITILCVYYTYFLSPKHHFQQGGWCGRPPWDPSPGVANRCRGNVYANRYRSNSSIVCVVLEHTYKHAPICIWVREPPTSISVSPVSTEFGGENKRIHNTKWT